METLIFIFIALFAILQIVLFFKLLTACDNIKSIQAYLAAAKFEYLSRLYDDVKEIKEITKNNQKPH